MDDPSPYADTSSVDFTKLINDLPSLPMDSLLDDDGGDAIFSEAFLSDIDLGLDGDFEINLDDLPVIVDKFLFDDVSDIPPSQLQINDESHGVVNCDSSLTSDIARFSNSQSHSPPCLDNSSDRNLHDSNEAKVPNFQLPESDPYDRESSGGPVSSQGSANGGLVVSDATDSPSPIRYDRDFTSQVVADENLKLDEIGKGSDLKRKTETNGGNAEARTTKHRKPLTPMDNATREPSVSVINEDDEKKEARLLRNRESAQLSRQRKKQYVEELEEKVKSMNSTIADLSGKISFFMAENATLRQQLSAGGMCPPPPPPGMYSHPQIPTVPYSWMPYAPYVANPLRAKVPLVPIPKLKSQQQSSASKSKTSERKKSVGKTKKVASVCFLGLLFFVLLFGGLAPLVNVKFDGLVDHTYGRTQYVSDRFHGQLGGKVMPINGPINGSEGYKGAGSSSEFVHNGNTSQPLFASLYIPRNDKMVKIDGNLVINSVLASEKAMASKTAHIVNNDKRETGLAISKYWDSALAIPEVGMNRGSHPYSYSSLPEQRKALPDGSAQILEDHLKLTASDGKIQQLFLEGLAGPMLSSGMCTEVFQFDISSTQGAIVAASSAARANVTEENHRNATQMSKNRNRRILHRFPLTGSSSTASDKQGGRNPPLNDNLFGNKSKSSMVVSVLIDPKEAADFDGMVAPKSLSRIFVVLLVDSIKYVTYSCVLPRSSSHPHRVTA